MIPQHLVVPRFSRGWVLALTAMAFFMVSLDLLVVITALPVMQRDLHAAMSALEWTVNAYSLASAAGIITAAALGDRFGRRRLCTPGAAAAYLWRRCFHGVRHNADRGDERGRAG